MIYKKLCRNKYVRHYSKITKATTMWTVSSKDSDFPENGFEEWGGYMQAKIAKLEDQFSTRANSEGEQASNIFNSISIFVNGYTNPSADELKSIMAKHGGVYHIYQRANDFIIASNLPDTKVKNQSLSKVVKPEWIVDSIASNCLLDYKDYLLYNQLNKTQPKLQFMKVFKNEKQNSIVDSNDKGTVSIKELVTEKDLKHEPIAVMSEAICTSHSLGASININKNYFDQIALKQSTTRTAVDPNFISEFYNNSRLHHISQLGACFKQYINELRDSNDFTFPARMILKQKILESTNLGESSKLNFQGGKVIMHIDMDCFFVSVGLRNRHELRGKPIAVTHTRTGQQKPGKRPGVDRSAEFNLYRQKNAKALVKAVGPLREEIRVETKVDNITDEDDAFGSMSEIASCSYEARSKGVSNGMFMGAALRLCPDLVTIPYDFDGYKEVAYTLYNTIALYTLDIEAVSCDEMYVDCTELIKSLNVNIQDIATALREEIRAKTGCPCSTGFGGNRLQARLATKHAKPDGQYFLTAELVEDFMMDIKLRDLPGVGRQTSHRLEALGHQTCGSLQSLSLPMLQQHLGNKTGAQLYDQCRGCDSNPLNFFSIRKSVSAEVNYGIRFENNEQCTAFLTQLSAEVHSRLQQFKVTGRCITLKLMIRAEEAPVETAKFMGHGFCNVINKSVTLAAATNDLHVITKEVLGICKKQKIDPKEMRGIGIQISKLENTTSKNITGGMTKFLLPKAEANGVNKDEDTIRPQLATTPKKPIQISPSKKRSPIGSLKSPTKRRRKNLGIKSLASTSRNVMNKFLQPNLFVHNSQNIAIQPIKNAEVIVAQTDESNYIDNSISQIPWETVRGMLRAWVDTKSPPLQCDVKFLATYLTDMVVQKHIDKVKVLMNFLQRKTSDIGSREWLDVYNRIVGEVQNAMLAVYGKKLLLYD